MAGFIEEQRSREIVQRAFDATVQLVVPTTDEAGRPRATAFFYADMYSDWAPEAQAGLEWDQRVWLITNRHVVWTDKHGPTSSLELILRDPGYTFGFKQPEEEQRITLDAEYLAANAWVPGFGYKAPPDIAAIEMIDDVLEAVAPWVYYESEIEYNTGAGETLSMPRNPRVRMLTRQDCGEPSTNPMVGSQVLAIGYPDGGVDEITGIPIAKSGTVATDFVGGWQAEEAFLVDINQFPGSSGSPILTASQPALYHDPDTGTTRTLFSKPLLVGIHSGGRTHKDELVGKDESVGLGVAWSLPWSIFSVLDVELEPVTVAAWNAGVS